MASGVSFSLDTRAPSCLSPLWYIAFTVYRGALHTSFNEDKKTLAMLISAERDRESTLSPQTNRLCPACGPTDHPRDVCEERVLHEHSSLWASSSVPTLSSEPRRKEEGENEPSEASVVAWRLPEPHPVRGTVTVHATKAAGSTSVPAQLSQISFSTVFTRDESELQGNSRACEWVPRRDIRLDRCLEQMTRRPAERLS